MALSLHCKDRKISPSFDSITKGYNKNLDMKTNDKDDGQSIVWLIHSLTDTGNGLLMVTPFL